jgi:hypothetical protein
LEKSLIGWNGRNSGAYPSKFLNLVGQLMTSNKIYYRLFKYGFLAVGLLIISLSIISWIAPESITINGEPSQKDFYVTAIFGLIGVVLILIFIVIKDKFAIVEIKNQTITISHLGHDITVSWMDVEQISQMQFVYPPLYRIKVKTFPEVIWFNTQPKYFEINGFVTDVSDMGDFIKKKKKELGI